VIGDLCGCGRDLASGLRAGDRAHVPLLDLHSAALGQAGLTVHVAAVPEHHALGAQHGRQAHPAVQHAVRKPPLLRGLVVDQDGGQHGLGL